MQDGTWLRSYNDKSVWLGGGHYATNGCLSLGYGGGVNTAYRAQINGSVVVENGTVVITSGYVNFHNNGYSYQAGSEGRGIRWGMEAGESYAIYKGPGTSLGGSYAQLRLAWHTGLQIGAQSVYGGVRFYNSEAMTGILFSVGEGDNNTRVYGTMIHGSTVVSNTTYMRDTGLYLRGEGNTGHGLRWAGSWAGYNVDGPVLHGYGGGVLGTTAYGQRAAMIWDAANNVSFTGQVFVGGNPMPNVMYGTGYDPPAGPFPEGTIYVQVTY